MSATPWADRKLRKISQLTVPTLFLADIRNDVLQLLPRFLVQAAHARAQLEYKLEAAISIDGARTHASLMKSWEKAGVSSVRREPESVGSCLTRRPE